MISSQLSTESNAPSIEHNLPPDCFAQIFPFHFVFNRNLEIVQAGKVLQRIAPEGLIGGQLDQFFQIQRPKVGLDYDALIKKSKKLFLIESIQQGFQLKGQLMPVQTEEVIFFIGSLWVTDLCELKENGVKLQDFAIHEPTSDFLYLLQAKSTALADTTKLTEELTLKQTELEQTLQIVQDKNENLQATLQQLEATQDQLIQSEKMASLGQLIAGIAHEINTPLGAIRSSVENISDFLERNLRVLPSFFQNLTVEGNHLFGELLDSANQDRMILSSREKRKLKRGNIRMLEEQGIEQADDVADTLAELNYLEKIEAIVPRLRSPEGRQTLDMAYQFSTLLNSTKTIKTATDKAAKVVFALKSYTHFDHSGNKSTTNLINDIETVLTLYQSQLKNGVEVIRNYGPIPSVSCFHDELSQVWTNLIHNALQAMDYQGTLTLDVKQQDHQVQVKIADSGQGIPAEVMPKIFQPFFTTKPPGEGSGLGLDIVKKIVAKHEGEITVESEPGNTQFTVSIPLA
ncbi:ATP-binding protein [Acaryochloris sp. IP29b_bin.137]|uniref:ATP-binding protein n=1 Tax=Acaryochloris sp. IP29b_bin.137 TaxID=2969217 RepID=UPI00260A9186|nr:ATP-binding protein [Acaryochloris sp. IP29b_bin.137]